MGLRCSLLGHSWDDPKVEQEREEKRRELIEQIDAAGPFGAGAPGPRFVFADSRISFARQLGDAHLKLRITDEFGPSLDAIAFGAFDTALGPARGSHEGLRFHLAGRLEINTWGGRRSVQLRLEDAAPAS